MRTYLCLVCGCSEDEVSKLHCFPSNSTRCKSWLVGLGLPYFERNMRNMRICNKHFSQMDYLNNWKLKPNAIPMRFVDITKNGSDRVTDDISVETHEESHVLTSMSKDTMDATPMRYMDSMNTGSVIDISSDSYSSQESVILETKHTSLAEVASNSSGIPYMQVRPKMEATDIDADFNTVEKVRLKCCKTESSSLITCTVCGKVYHQSCARRDWIGKVKIIDSTRLICLEHVVPNDEAKNEIQLLKDLVTELKSKNRILEGNNALLRERERQLTGKLRHTNPH